MCGRYVAPDVAALERFWNTRFPGNTLFESTLRPQLAAAFSKVNYNTVKTQTVSILRIGESGPEIVPARWGVDHEDQDKKRLIVHNIRRESLKRYEPWIGPWKANQRAVQLVHGYYEWRVGGDGKKIPYYIRPSDQAEIFGLAGLWDNLWDDDADPPIGVAHVTLPPGPLLGKIHSRMPSILRAEDQDTWLTGSADEAFALTKPYPDELITLSRIKPKVNSTRNNGPDLLDPDKDAPGLFED